MQGEIKRHQMCVEGDHSTNHKDCVVYKDLYKSFFLALRRRVILPEIQLRNCIHTNYHIQERSYASVTRNETINYKPK